MHILLASGSPYRKLQLQNFGVRFSAEPPPVDEGRLKAEGPRDLTELTRFLAARKATALARLHPDAFVIGADQLAECDGVRLDKPGSVAGAVAQLRRLAGREHRLITSVALVRGERVEVGTEVTHVILRDLSEDEINAYVALDRPLDCAGSYKIERAGLGLIAGVRGGDPGAIQGLPLIALVGLFKRFDVNLTELWRADAHH